MSKVQKLIKQFSQELDLLIEKWKGCPLKILKDDITSLTEIIGSIPESSSKNPSKMFASGFLEVAEYIYHFRVENEVMAIG